VIVTETKKRIDHYYVPKTTENRKRAPPTRWNAKEKQLLMDSINKNGGDQRQIEKDVGTKTIDQIRVRVSLMERAIHRQTIMTQQDRERLRVLARFHNYAKWTAAETRKLAEGEELFGSDHRRLAQHIKTKNYEQVRARVHHMKQPQRQRGASSSAESARPVSAYFWTQEDQTRFAEAVKMHGRDYAKISKHVGTKTYDQVKSYKQRILTKLEKEPENRHNYDP